MLVSRRASVLGLAVVAALTLPHVASAATIAVTSNADAGPGTLRAAIADASAGDTITVPPMAITLTTGELSIAEDLTIVGAGARSTIVSGGNASRVFEVSTGTVGISGMTITNGAGRPVIVERVDRRRCTLDHVRPAVDRPMRRAGWPSRP
jgi:hypothetical protein